MRRMEELEAELREQSANVGQVVGMVVRPDDHVAAFHLFGRNGMEEAERWANDVRTFWTPQVFKDGGAPVIMRLEPFR